MGQQRYCIIGAGAAGICAAKTALQAGGQVTVYERTDQIGGTWVYTDDVGTDRYGLPVHTSMYQGLRTNLPRDVMGFPDYEMPAQDASYVRSEDVLQFIRDYADHFEVVPHVRFERLVTEVRPVDEGESNAEWAVTVKDLTQNCSQTELFDFVLICNGHYFDPSMPDMPGRDVFQGRQVHSHDYRSAELFREEIVLVIGAGPSGRDLALEAATQAKKVFVSHHSSNRLPELEIPGNVEQVPDVERFRENSVEFVDGRMERITMVFYCTGYRYRFPFLHPDCGAQVSDNWVRPLYKHVMNIQRPTMAFIGLPFYVCAMPMFELQARFCVKFYSGENGALPDQQVMQNDHDREMDARWSKGLPKRKAHMMGEDYQAQYYKDLAETANITPMPAVLAKVHNDSSRRKKEDLLNYRRDVYRILDEQHFEVDELKYSGNWDE